MAINATTHQPPNLFLRFAGYVFPVFLGRSLRDHRVRFHDDVSGGARATTDGGGGLPTTNAAAAAVTAAYCGREKDPVLLGTGA